MIIPGAIPTSIGALTKLSKLELGPNRLSSTIPTEIGMLTDLVVLDFEKMLLTGTVPSEIGRLSKLAGLSFQNNNIVGTLPREISNLPNLDRKSAFEYIVWDAVGGQFHSQTLNWIFNVDEWGSPDNSDQSQRNKNVWANRYALAALYFQTCTTDACKEKTEWVARYHSICEWRDFDGWPTICSDNSTHIATRVVLELNGLQGTIPTEIGMLSSLEHLDLGSSNANMLNGRLPAEIFQLTKLTLLDLETNQLTGTIPSLSSFRLLRDLNLGFNQFGGTIPAVADLTNLQSLRLADNNLIGTIPEMISLTQLSWLDLGFNNLRGDVPDLRPSGTVFTFCRLGNNANLGNTNFAAGDNCFV